MKEVTKKKDGWEQTIIYVSKCDRFSNLYKSKRKDLHNSNTERICDILEAVENYYIDSGE